MADSRAWRIHFERNAASLPPIPWEVGADLTDEESVAIAASLQEFQAGKYSEGHHLHRFAREYAATTGDYEFLKAIRLFIAEEQRHALYLGRFLALNGIPLVDTTIADWVFRRLRNLVNGDAAGLLREARPTMMMGGRPGLWREARPAMMMRCRPGLVQQARLNIAVMVTAELIATVYFAALRDATRSVLLRRLCDQILRDEHAHVGFLSERLQMLRAGRSPVALTATLAAQRLLYAATVTLVGWSHRRVIWRGGLTFEGWWTRCWREFDEAMTAAWSATASRTAVVRHGADAQVPAVGQNN